MNTAWIVSLALLVAGEPGPTPAALGQDVWPLTLPEAIRIGVKNSGVIRVVEDRGAIRVVPRDGSVEGQQLVSSLMAHVRSIEQQYWALVLQDVQVWAREMAVKACEEVMAREQVDSDPRNKADVAEARQNLERSRLASITATSDRITTERQLRNILGLPPTDHRRIVPVTAPVEARVEPDWERCLAAMMKEQPDILLGRQAVAEAERRGARGEAKSPAPVGLPADVADASDSERAKAEVDRRRDALQQSIHQSTHALARFFLEIDANYKQFRMARRLREAARVRLDQARAYYKEGKAGFTVDRLLDAIAQYSDAVAQEAQYKCIYNTALVMLDEAKGTLLAERKIIVVDPSPRGVDAEVKAASFTSPTDVPPAPPKPDARPAPTPAGARVIRYDISLEGGPAPIQLKGTVSIGPPAGR